MYNSILKEKKKSLLLPSTHWVSLQYILIEILLKDQIMSKSQPCLTQQYSNNKVNTSDLQPKLIKIQVWIENV